jgi:hypothetical protein
MPDTTTLSMAQKRKASRQRSKIKAAAIEQARHNLFNNLTDETQCEVIESLNDIVSDYNSVLENAVEEADYQVLAALEEVIEKYGYDVVVTASESACDFDSPAVPGVADLMIELHSSNPGLGLVNIGEIDADVLQKSVAALVEAGYIDQYGQVCFPEWEEKSIKNCKGEGNA